MRGLSVKSTRTIDCDSVLVIEEIFEPLAKAVESVRRFFETVLGDREVVLECRDERLTSSIGQRWRRDELTS
jgi:hypothetical protein